MVSASTSHVNLWEPAYSEGSKGLLVNAAADEASRALTTTIRDYPWDPRGARNERDGGMRSRRRIKSLKEG